MIRISGGHFRGRQIYSPKGKDIRPTTSFVRESLFSMLGPHIIEARFLDLFAGCGVVGFEALSRGADLVRAVEMLSTHCQLLEKNREHLKIPADVYQVTCQDVFAWVKRCPAVVSPQDQYDIIYLDPPYALENVVKVVQECFSRKILAPTGILVWESANPKPPVITGAECFKSRRYGLSNLSFFRYQTQSPEPQTESPALSGS